VAKCASLPPFLECAQELGQQTALRLNLYARASDRPYLRGDAEPLR
jgi:hypothetical protein